MKTVLRVVLIIVCAVIVIAALAFGLYWRKIYTGTINMSVRSIVPGRRRSR